ncbi:hypothetical protein BHM03_00039145 [Ensete ventricosum]|nr:hypothetical protein BHM03_00039145 [Ensete ventricosum]
MNPSSNVIKEKRDVATLIEGPKSEVDPPINAVDHVKPSVAQTVNQELEVKTVVVAVHVKDRHDHDHRVLYA